MGDQISNAVTGTLFFAPADEFARVLALRAEPAVTTALFADLCRLNSLYMIARAGSGHIGSSFSCLDMLSWLLLHELRSGDKGPRDTFFSSKGHDAPAYYAALTGIGRLRFDLIHALRRVGGLPGHPDVAVEGVETNTGSLGMGISKAKGMAFANRRRGLDGRVYVLTGDGELQEGQIWESLISAANEKLDEITAIVDHNKLQSDTFVAKTSDLGDLERKFAAFNWHVERVDGHDIPAFAAAVLRCKGVAGRPQVIIADTIKGRGISFMEHTAFDSDVELYKFHSGAPGDDAYSLACRELIDRIDSRLRELGQTELRSATAEQPARPSQPSTPQRLVDAYSRALIAEARTNPDIVALDADLLLDTGLVSFKKMFPDRFVECGIAEMDMVSQAGGMALRGLLPVVHSFACFLSARPNEQIYNNATEQRQIIYVGSLAGVVPGGPGHSHQAVRDIAALSAVPGLTMVEPSCEAEVAPLLRWCVHENPGSSYMRLVSIPCELPFDLPADYRVRPGQGVALTEGRDVVLITYGPVMLSEAYKAASLLQEEGIEMRVVNLPWLNQVDDQWLTQAVDGARMLFTLDNHYVAGGQGQMIAATVAETALPLRVRRLGVTGIPVCGSNDEVLSAHGLDATSLCRTISMTLGN